MKRPTGKVETARMRRLRAATCDETGLSELELARVPGYVDAIVGTFQRRNQRLAAKSAIAIQTHSEPA